MKRTILSAVLSALAVGGTQFITIEAQAQTARREAVQFVPRAPGLAGCPAGLATDARSAEWLSGAARMLAGFDVEAGSLLAPVSERPSVKEHRQKFIAEWGAFEGKRLRPIAQFHSRELGAVTSSSGPLFYPFSGPDIAYAMAFFPAATSIVMTGLEPVGNVPDFSQLDEATLDASLDQLRSSLRSILALSFFVTREMDADLRRTRLAGVTPIMMLFLARHGFEINAVQPILLDAEDRLCPQSAESVNDIKAKDARIPGVLIRFQKPGESIVRSVYYLKTDLSDAGLARRTHYLRFVESFKPKATLVKSASYLLHFKEFSILRDHILRQSPVVLQDDSGVPFRYYGEGWEQRLYGRYVGPIPVFKHRYQREMNDAYERAALPLGFGIGYRYESHQSNLQLFIRRPAEVLATGARS